MDNSYIIKKIEIRLKELGYSKSEFYKGSGITSATFSQWNTNKFEPSDKKLKDAADFLGVSVEYLKGEKEKPATGSGDELDEYLEMLKNRPECRMLFQLSRDATKEEVEQAVKIIEALRQK